MNPIIAQYFDMIEVWLVQSPIIVSYQVIRQEITPVDGKLRLKTRLSDRGMLEFFEYVVEADGDIQLSKYSFHWQDAQGKLKTRWDNAPIIQSCPIHRTMFILKMAPYRV
jgi:hypothetical protein